VDKCIAMVWYNIAMQRFTINNPNQEAYYEPQETVANEFEPGSFIQFFQNEGKVEALPIRRTISVTFA
jgi:hypothetical protein